MRYRTYQITELCSLIKGKYATLKTEQGKYPLVVTASFRRSANSYQLVGPAVCVPLISSTGHGHAAINRIHYQEGKFALANLLVALIPKEPDVCNAKYLFFLLSARKDEYLVPLMLGTANVSLKIQDIAEVKIPLPPIEEQKRIVTFVEHLKMRVEEVKRLRTDSIEESEELFLAQLTKVINSARGHQVELRKIVKIRSGKGLKRSDRDSDGKYEVYGSNGILGFHSEYLVEQPTIIIGRKGSTGKLTLTKGPCWPIDTTYYAIPLMPLDLRYLYYLLLEKKFDELPTRSPKPGIRSSDIYPISVNFVQNINEQKEIVAYLDSFGEKVDELRKLQHKVGSDIERLLCSILDRVLKGEL